MTRIVPSYSQPAPRRRTSFYAVLLAAAVLGAPGVARASAPEWLRTAAAQTLPAYPDDTAAVVLFDEQITTVHENGEIDTLYRGAYKILRTEGRDYGSVVVYFSKETRLMSLMGWSLPAGGKEYEVKEKDAIETSSFGETLFDDARFKILKIPAAEPGNIVGFEYQQRGRPWILQDTWKFQRRIPVLRARFSLQLPPNWEFKPYWRHYAGLEPQAAGSNAWVWELRNIPSIEAEISMPAWRVVAGKMGVSYYPSDPALAARGQKSWQDIGRWYNGLTADRRGASPEIQQKALELTRNIPTTLGKIQALAAYIQDNIRYVAIEIGIGGYQPHPAAQVFANKYGDCKDKATILSTMLKEIGVNSYYVLVQTERGIVIPEFPTALEFNHVTLAIQLPAGVDTSDLYATVQHDRLGKLLFFDPTDPFTPLGYLPVNEQENRVLLTTDEGGELVRLPLLGPARNQLERTAKLVLSPDGSLSGDVTEVRTGAFAISERAALLSVTSANRAKKLESLLGASLSSFSLQRASVENLESHDAKLVLRYTFTADHYAQTAGNLVLVRPRVLGVKGQDFAQKHERKFPVEQDFASQQSDTFEITLPPGFAVDDLPNALNLDTPFATYRSKAEINNNVLRYQRTFEVKEVMVPSERFAEVNKFYRQVIADERSSAVMKRITP